MEAAAMAGHPLRVSAEGSDLVLRIGAEVLKFAAEESDELQVHRDGEYHGPTVTDAAGFAHEVALAMNAVAEDGSTPASLFVDEMIRAAIEDGAEHIAMPEDEEAES